MVWRIFSRQSEGDNLKIKGGEVFPEEEGLE
jgi:hypothetical protein